MIRASDVERSRTIECLAVQVIEALRETGLVASHVMTARGCEAVLLLEEELRQKLLEQE